jgi:ribosomal protein S18 acetylase RimI-like enzyme
VTTYSVRPLNRSTWSDFARLVEKHGGIWGGCWCMAFHPEGVGTGRTRSDKERRVWERQAHAALVYDGPACVGWCQFGPTDELPRIKHRREYLDGVAELPRWRITCFFVDRDYRHRGVASAALRGALREIARLGGGTLESYPQDVHGRSVSGSFLYNGTLAMFERQGFRRRRRLGKNHWVVSKSVRKAPEGKRSAGGKGR